MPRFAGTPLDDERWNIQWSESIILQIRTLLFCESLIRATTSVVHRWGNKPQQATWLEIRDVQRSPTKCVMKGGPPATHNKCCAASGCRRDRRPFSSDFTWFPTKKGLEEISDLYDLLRPGPGRPGRLDGPARGGLWLGPDHPPVRRSASAGQSERNPSGEGGGGGFANRWGSGPNNMWPMILNLGHLPFPNSLPALTSNAIRKTPPHFTSCWAGDISERVCGFEWRSCDVLCVI